MESATPRQVRTLSGDGVCGPFDFAALLEGCTLPLDAQSLAGAARQLVAVGPALPLPGGGSTLARWQFLAGLAGQDLSLLKIYEAHADALAIQSELEMPCLPHVAVPRRLEPEIWGVWAARSPRNELRYASSRSGQILLSGVKPWCSGAAFVTHALVTCIDSDDRDWLAALPMDQPGVTVTARGWEAVGMAATQSVEIDVLNAHATLVGPVDGYLRRPGFWHGGAGIAACWYGAAAALAVRLRDAARRRDDPHLNAHLGAADAALSAARALLRDAAHKIDSAPHADAMALALRARAAAESAVEATLHACARGLGAGPLCRDRWFAHMAADLPVFVRQSHAEHDLAALAKRAAADEDWTL
ncbi:acyl-CoA dehydrogenase [Paraburkholderia sp. BR14312]|uniref:acyl-CoA dehydrogenase n=1 Tax=unclassified Paraburkholderia TaxID=2615204 RepID=UPI0034CD3739